MTKLRDGVHYLESSIRIQAPVEVCYQAWLDAPHFPDFMSRVIAFQYRPKGVVIPASVEEIQSRAQLLKQDIVPMSTIKHWLLSGPSCKLYEIDSTVILEIPNRFYCTTSTDPNDLSIQSSLSFMPDQMNRNTIIKWQISFWAFDPPGKMTSLASDILEAGDAFLENNLQDFKAHLEAN